jgi:hypothetical protein
MTISDWLLFAALFWTFYGFLRVMDGRRPLPPREPSISEIVWARGMVTINDIRQLEGFPPAEGGAVLMNNPQMYVKPRTVMR